MDNAKDLLIFKIQDLYDAEHQIIDALPAMIENAKSQQLSQALDQHLTETKQQRDKLEEAFEALGEDPARETCEGMQGIITEGEELMARGDMPDALLDAAIADIARAVEHYEIACYSVAIALCEAMGQNKVLGILRNIRSQEQQTDTNLQTLSQQSLNPKAVQL